MRPGASRSGAAQAAGAQRERLGEDRDGGLGRALGTDVEPGRAAQPRELGVGQPASTQPLAPLRLGAPAAERADVERVGAQRCRERRDVELVVVRQHDDGGVAVGRDLRERLVGPFDDDLVGARHALAASRTRPRIDADRVPADSLRGGAERLAGVDGADDDQARRRAEHLREDPRAPVLELAVAPDIRRQRRQRRAERRRRPRRGRAARAACCPTRVALEHGEEHGPLLAVGELEQRLGEAQSSRSRKTSISPPHGSPTPSACSSEMP